MSEGVIPLSEPSLGGNASRYLEECLRTNFVSSVGPFVRRFELEFADFVGSRHAVACASGTAALHVALRVLGIGPDDEVFVPSLTFVASANAAAYLAASVTLVDSERETWNLDPDLVIDEIERRAKAGLPQPRAIEVVHLLGHPARIEPLIDLCDECGIVLVEDAAEALGSRFLGGALSGRHVGTIGRIGCFSFNGNKIITAGGGGMLVTDDEALAVHARHLTTQARLPGLAYQYDEVGYNYRLTNLAAALGVSQLERLPEFIDRKRAIATRYDKAFQGHDQIELAPRQEWAYPTFWLYSIRLPERDHAVSLLARLNESGIDARPVWTPLHLTGPYRESRIIGSGQTAASVAATSLSLPSSVGLSDEDQEAVIETVIESLAR